MLVLHVHDNAIYPGPCHRPLQRVNVESFLVRQGMRTTGASLATLYHVPHSLGTAKPHHFPIAIEEFLGSECARKGGKGWGRGTIGQSGSELRMENRWMPHARKETQSTDCTPRDGTRTSGVAGKTMPDVVTKRTWEFLSLPPRSSKFRTHCKTKPSSHLQEVC